MENQDESWRMTRRQIISDLETVKGTVVEVRHFSPESKLTVVIIIKKLQVFRRFGVF